MEGRARQEGARPVSLLQGLQIGMPDQRGRCYVQSRVFGPLLRGQETPSSCVCIRNDRSLGATRIDCPVRRQFFLVGRRASATSCRACCTWPRSGACLSSPAPHSNTGLEKIEFSASEKTPSLLPPEHRIRAKLSCGRIRSTITFIPKRAVPRSKFFRLRASRPPSRKFIFAAGDLCTIAACSTGPKNTWNES